MLGIDDLVARAKTRIKSGLIAYDALERLKADRKDAKASVDLDVHAHDLGYALLLKRYVADPRKADEAQIAKAAADTVPGVVPLFWSFRIMVGLGFYFIALFVDCLLLHVQARLLAHTGCCGCSYGRCRCRGSPPNSAGSSPNTAASLGRSTACCRPSWRRPRCRPRRSCSRLCGFVLFYSSLAVVDFILMRKYVRMGPVEALGQEFTPAPHPANAS